MITLSSLMIGSVDPKKLAEFYTKVFGKDAEWQDGDWYGWRSGNVFFMIGMHDKVAVSAREPERMILNFEATDVQKEFDRVKALGAQVIKEPYQIEENWLATLADPDGNYFQLATPWKM